MEASSLFSVTVQKRQPSKVDWNIRKVQWTKNVFGFFISAE